MNDFTLSDDETDPFKLAEQKRWLDLARLGKEAWNTWATAELKKPLEDRVDVDLSDQEVDVSDFLGFIFPANANFSRTKFSSKVIFVKALFSADVFFRECVFGADAYFFYTIFEAESYFTDAEFSGDAFFSWATFSSGTSFRDANFLGSIRLTYQTPTWHQDDRQASAYQPRRGNLFIGSSAALENGAS